jgi:hypothetical protein
MMRVPNVALADDRSRVIGRATLGLTVYFDDDGTWSEQGAAAAFRALLGVARPDRLTWCTTSLALSGFLLNASELAAFEAQLVAPFGQRAPRHLFSVRLADTEGAPSCEFYWRAADPARGERTNVIAMHLPTDTPSDVLHSLFAYVVGCGPVLSGNAGFRLSWDRSHSDLLAPRFTALGARFIALDLSDAELMAMTVAKKHLVTVNWLTFLGDALLGPAPHVSAPPAGSYDADVTVLRHAQGVLVAAGRQPTTGDLNTLTLPHAYFVAAHLVAPWLATRVPDYWPSAVGGEATGRWLGRFTQPDAG